MHVKLIYIHVSILICIYVNVIDGWGGGGGEKKNTNKKKIFLRNLA